MLMVDGIITSNIEDIETNKVKLTFCVSPQKFEEGLRFSYNKNKANINIQGFRKGKVPRAMAERVYGKSFFFADAVDYLFDDLFPKVVHSHKINPVQQPSVDISEISTEEGVTFVAEMLIEPLLKVTAYKGMTYVPVDMAVTDGEIDEYISRDKDKNARVITIEDRPAQTGDTVIIDFEGRIDGEPFEGGQSNNFDLVLGSGRFIDTFEEQIVGMAVGDERTVSVTFPDPYPNSPELSGKPAEFMVKLNELQTKEYPELDDDFAQDVSDFETFAEYKADIVKKITENKERNAKFAKENQLIAKLTTNIEGEIPPVMFESMAERIYRDYLANIERRGLNYETYLQYSQDTDENMRARAAEDADMRIKSRLALTAVAAQENIEVSDDEVEEEINKIFANYGVKREDAKRDYDEIERDRVRDEVKVQKALDLVLESAVAVEADAAAAADSTGADVVETVSETTDGE